MGTLFLLTPYLNPSEELPSVEKNMAKPKFKLVKFVKPYGEYTPGRLAYLRDWLAEQLVDEEIAIPVNMQIEGTILA